MCLIPYLKVYHGSKKCLGSFFANGLLCWERGNALNPLRVNLFLMLVFIGPKSLPFNAFSLKSLQISLVWFSRNRLKMANPFCLLVKRPSAVMSEEKRLPFAGWEEERSGGEDKKTMVVLLVFFYDYFGGSFWSEKKTVGSKRLIWPGVAQGSGPWVRIRKPVSHLSPTIYHWNAWRIVNVVEGRRYKWAKSWWILPSVHRRTQ